MVNVNSIAAMVKKHPKRTRNSARATPKKRVDSLELLWKSRAAIRRGPKPVLTLADLVRAAIALVDARGLDSLTMANVAGRLDVTTMALYRYVPGKHELMELMSDEVMGAPPAAFEGGWRAQVERWARAYLAILSGRPWLLHVVERRTTLGPNTLAWLNSAIAAFSTSGLPDRDIVAAVLLVDGHVRSTAQLLKGAPATPQWAENFGRVLMQAQADPRYATLTRLVQSGAFAPAAEDGAPIPFEFGLQRILDGLESHAAAQRSMP
jgi:AcrR family transcriptional regulator